MNARALLDGLVRWEGRVPWMYRDSLGYATTGIGHLILDAEDACKLPWVTAAPVQVPATPEMVTVAFHAVMAAQPNQAAKFYAPLTSIRLLDEDIDALAVKRLEREFLPGLSRNFPLFDDYPESVRQALVDIAWNVGVRGIAKFSHLRAACDRGDWAAAAKACHVATSRAERNDWRADQFLAAVGAVPQEVA